MPILRRVLPGFACGVLCGILLAGGFCSISIGLAVGAVLGMAYALALPRPIGDHGAAADLARIPRADALRHRARADVVADGAGHHGHNHGG